MLGSTDASSRIFFAETNFAIDSPADPCTIFWADGNVVDVDPDAPVLAVPIRAVMISSSIALPIAAAAVLAYTDVGSDNNLTLS